MDISATSASNNPIDAIRNIKFLFKETSFSVENASFIPIATKKNPKTKPFLVSPNINRYAWVNIETQWYLLINISPNIEYALLRQPIDRYIISDIASIAFGENFNFSSIYTNATATHVPIKNHNGVQDPIKRNLLTKIASFITKLVFVYFSVIKS